MGSAGWRPVTLGRRGGGSVDFVDFVTLMRSRRGGSRRGGPGGSEGGIAVLEGIGRLAAHPRGAGGEGDRARRGEGDDEGDSAIGRPFAGAARAAGTRQE